jgi:subtilisin family serine protease
MRLKNKLQYLLLVGLSIIFIACGGGSSGSSSSTTSSGTFVDSKVIGLRYSTATQSGLTDINGAYKYKNGETIKFYIGNIYIGQTTGQSVITPIDIVNGGSINNTRVLNIARLLQTLDSDKNPSNGITLVDAVKNFTPSFAVDFTNDNNITTLINEINASDSNLSLIEVNSSDAKNHLETSLHINFTGDDTNYSSQWHLDNTHLNTTAIHNEYNGSSGSTIIQIVDDGIEALHDDLIGNLDLSLAYNAQTATSGNCDPSGNDSHGTKCAGITSARGFNGIGIRGISPLGKVTGFKFRTNNNGGFYVNKRELEKAWISGDGANDITVSSNSWATCVNNSTQYEEILKWGSENLRDGKGRIYIVSAGNGREGDSGCPNTSKMSSANLSYLANNPYAITVGALNKNDTYAKYSNPGSNLWISAYGGDSSDSKYITTTNINNSYTNQMSGTSASTPMVAGGVALLIEACPTLTYRDVKYILAKTAIQIDSANTTWVTNSADINHSVDYGFGKLNISGAIDMCKGRNGYSPYVSLGDEHNITTIEDINSTDFTIPNNDINGIDVNITVSENKKVEWVGVYIDGNIDNFGEIELKLTSPNGTTTKLLHSNNSVGTASLNSETRFSSVAFLDENSSGVWTVNIADKNSNNQTNRSLTNVRLQIIGRD